MRIRNGSSLLPVAAMVAIAMSLICCVPPTQWFDRSNPADEESDAYQGYPTVETPEEFVLVSPVGETSLTFMPGLVVAEVLGAERYAVQVSTVSMVYGEQAFLAGLVFETDSAESNIVMPSGVSPDVGELYWRARCMIVGEWTEWRPPERFSILDPCSTTPLIPQNNEAVLPHPWIEWCTVDGAVDYELRMGASEGEMTASVAVSTGTAARHQLTTDAVGDTVYWSVRGVDEHGLYSPTSPARVFHVVSVVSPPAFAVRYDGNGSSAGAVPEDTNAYSAGASVTVMDNVGRLTHGGSLFFGGWNTSPDGSGSSYLPGATLSIAGGNVRLHAVWSETRVRRDVPLEHDVDTAFNNAESVYACDMDGDGDIDILGAAWIGDDIAWWENDGSENFTKHVVDAAFDGAYDVYATDVDGDGDIDVLGAAIHANDITWWENDGNENFAEHTVDGAFDGACDVHATDMDGDGDVDILGAAYEAGDITWWENDGAENFSEHTVDPSFGGAWSVYAADVDGDGNTDVLGAAGLYDHDITWWQNDGNENFIEHTVDGSFGDAYSVYGCDLDDDGDTDILGAARASDDIAWWENDGAEGFTEHTVDGAFDMAVDVYASDLDGDGDVDIIGAASNADEIAWWENDGTKNFLKHTIAGDFDAASSVYAADLDRDGDMEILGAGGGYMGRITWWSLWYD